MIGVVLSGQHGMGIVELLIVVPCIGIVRHCVGIVRLRNAAQRRGVALCRQSTV